MRFIKTTTPELVAGYMAGVIQAHLDTGRRVLWLLSGGSGIKVAVAAWRLLDTAAGDLTIGQIDERYGPVGHPNANWGQLEAAGLQPRAGETTEPILTGKPFAETATDYAQRLSEELLQADVAIGFFGIGADGHTAGILPHSPALHSPELVAHYTGPDFERITITEKVMERLDVAVAYAPGEAKRPQLERLQGEASPDSYPMQLLKLTSTVVFSDTVGEDAHEAQ